MSCCTSPAGAAGALRAAGAALCDELPVHHSSGAAQRSSHMGRGEQAAAIAQAVVSFNTLLMLTCNQRQATAAVDPHDAAAIWGEVSRPRHDQSP
jgi:hypothetical protein